MTLPSEILGEGLSDRYRLERQVGAGGMATVYLAHDLRHDRKVAIKVLHPELAAVIGAERFLAEIRTTASLQHPHILPLFDSGAIAAEGAREARLLFYVMPFIEGESLRQRLTRERQLPVADAVRIASEVASALDYAHRKGIVHRDIKPENVLLHDGSALVADFGIALAVTAAGGGRLTQTGLSLGTPAYMSPEQAMGEREIGPRSDVYALGAVTYEMLSGEPPFTGPSSQAIVARTLTEQPRPLRTERKSIPPEVEAAVLQALEKLPADRQGSAKELADQLAGQGPVKARTAATTILAASGAGRGQRRQWASLLAGGAALAALGFVAGRTLAPASGGALAGTPVEFRPSEMGTLEYFSVSQDGQYLVGTSPDSNGVNHVVLRRVSDSHVSTIPGTSDATRAWLTPDNQSLVVRRERSLSIQPVAGGSSRELLQVTGYVTVEWMPGDSMLVVVQDRLRMVALDGSGSREVAAIDSTQAAIFYIPRLLPGGRNILVGKRFNIDSVELVQMDLRTGQSQPVMPNVQEVRPYAPDRLLWLDGEGRVRYGTYDQSQRTVGSRQVVLAEEVDDLFANGDVIMLRPGQAKQDLQVRRGAGGEVDRLTIPDTSASVMTFSPDGRKMSVMLTPVSTARRVNDVVVSSATGLWVIDRTTGLRTMVMEHASEASWFPDGKRLLVLRRRPSPGKSEIYIATADGSVPPVLVPSDGRSKFQCIVAPGGAGFTCIDFVSRQTRLYSLAGGEARQLQFDDVGSELGAVFSPDGKWMLYANERPDGAFLVARSWPDLARRVVIGGLGFCPAAWADGGRKIYWCVADGTLVSVGFDPAGRLLGSAQPVSFVTQKNPEFGVDPTGSDLAWIPSAPRYGTEPRVLANWRADAERRLLAR